MFKWLNEIFYKKKSERIQIRLKLNNGKYYEEFVNIENHEKRLKELEAILDNHKPIEETTFIWCLIGNVINENYSGVEKEIKHGTKHFSPNTKVYCFPISWGDGYEDIKVIGRHRKTSKNINIIIPSKLITNWRIQKVYHPFILKSMRLNRGWNNSEKDKNTILEMLKWLPSRTLKFE